MGGHDSFHAHVKLADTQYGKACPVRRGEGQPSLSLLVWPICTFFSWLFMKYVSVS